ncbi:T9SS type A sorting domain-containing protein [Draconibacterium sediminis]|uniref:Secretion system C-terminal sorting domain-containing protein n=1 Tax=Draconibacterium sediminis TaxID=1544798 RepID=A0A0D8JBP7_9BACT|nr:T9SS type A sorting domain-containing protein [Draconibacterium sediminis]KJF44164.1 hypothetical protein LH29_01150 [Draconibacterium sediminis]
MERINKKIYLLLFTWLVFHSVNAQQYFQWTTKLGGFSDDYVNSIVCPMKDKIYAAGGFVDTIYSDGEMATGYGMRDIYLACYNSNGTTDWIKTLGGKEADNVTRLAVGEKCIYMVGVLKGEAKQNKKSFAGDGQSLFIASWSFNGKINWLKRFDYEGVVTIDALEVSPEGKLITGGMLQGSLTINDEKFGYSDKKRAYVLQLTEEGNPEKHFLSDGTGEHRLVSVTLDKDNNGYYLFSTTGEFSFGNNTQKYADSNGKDGLFLTKAKDLNNSDWVKFFDVKDYAEGVGVVNSSKNLFVTINFRKEISTQDTTLTTNSRQAVALFAYNFKGDPLWGEVINGSSRCRAMDVMCNMAGNVLVTGYYDLAYEVGQTTVEANNLEGSIFLLQFDEHGQVVWHNEPGDNAPNFSKSFTLSRDGDILLAGGFKGELELEGKKLVSEGSTDIFIARYFNCDQLETKILDPGPICSGGTLELSTSGSFVSYVWNNSEWSNTYTIHEPGTYVVAAYNELGCAANDTIVITEAESEQLGLPKELELYPGKQEVLEANAGFFVYDWMDGTKGRSRIIDYDSSADSVLYILNATTLSGCDIADTTLVIFYTDGAGPELMDGEGLIVYPNPVNDDLFWSYSSAKEEIKVLLINEKGETILQKKLLDYLPNTQQKIDMRMLSSGNYLLTLSFHERTISKKIIKR